MDDFICVLAIIGAMTGISSLMGLFILRFCWGDELLEFNKAMKYAKRFNKLLNLEETCDQKN